MKDEKYYPQGRMQNNANTSKKKKEIRHITDDPEIYSDDSNEG